MKKKDLIVIAIILVIAGILFGGMFLKNNASKNDEKAGTVYYGNKVF